MAALGLCLVGAATPEPPAVSPQPGAMPLPQPAATPQQSTAQPQPAPPSVMPPEPSADSPEQFDSRRFVRHLSGTETCLVCHGNYNPEVLDAPGKVRSLWIDSRLFLQSSHARLGCKACHKNIDKFGHQGEGIAAGTIDCAPCHTAEQKSTPAQRAAHQQQMETRSGYDMTQTIAISACIGCHEKEYEQYKRSVHGQSMQTHGVEGVPFCINCHGMHYILPSDDPRSATNPLNVPSTCLNCHAQADVKLRAGLTLSVAESYESSFHGKRSELGYQSVAVCTTCHGSHEIYAPSDPRSMVNRARVAQTCGECHEGAQLNFAAAFTHKTVSPKEQLGLYILQQIYSWVIFLLIAQFALFALLDIYRNYRMRKAVRELHAAQAAAGVEDTTAPARRVYERFNLHHRIQHFFMAFPFTMLVVTGWPLRFPELPVSKLMSSWVGGPIVIGIMHRTFGVTLILVSLYHIGYLLLKFARGKRSVAMLPSWRDAQEALGDVLFWLGLRKRRMDFGRYNWIEKVEYYAVVWGTAVMILSGLVIWVPTVAARFLPSWAIPASVIVHGYEALLAGLAIFLWHFYWVHLHPSVYPMSSVWLTGKLTEAEMEHHHPRELERLREAQAAATEEEQP